MHVPQDVNGLLDENQLCWHFHQLFHQLRVANRGSHRDALEDDLGHVDNMLGNRQKRVEELKHVQQLFHHQRHRSVKRLQTRNGIDDLFHGVPLDTYLRPSTQRLPHQTTGRTPGEEGASVVVTRRASRAPPPWPCSVPLGLRGGCSRPRPWRRSSVHTASTHGSVALFAALWHPARVHLRQPPT